MDFNIEEEDILGGPQDFGTSQSSSKSKKSKQKKQKKSESSKSETSKKSDILSKKDEELIKNGCGIVITDTKQFYRIFRTLLNDKNYRDEIGEKCKPVFADKIGVSRKIIDQITKTIN